MAEAGAVRAAELALSEAALADGHGHVDHMGLQVESGDVVQRELARVKSSLRVVKGCVLLLLAVISRLACAGSA